MGGRSRDSLDTLSSGWVMVAPQARRHYDVDELNRPCLHPPTALRGEKIKYGKVNVLNVTCSLCREHFGPWFASAVRASCGASVKG